jgi:cytochrome P450
MTEHTPVNPTNLASPAFINDPYPAYRQFLTQLPVCWDEPNQTWLVSRYDDVHAVLRDKRYLSGRVDSMMDRLSPDDRAAAAPLRELLTNRLVLSDNPAHARIRALVQQAFVPRRIEAMRSFIQRTADELLDRAAAAGRMDLVADFADPLPSRVITAMLGLPAADQERFKTWTDDIYAFLGVSTVPLPDRARKATASARQLSAYLADAFAEIRKHPRDDLLSALVAAEQAGDRLTETELFSNVVGIINGSHETTANLISNTVLTLLRHPDQLARLRAEPALIAGAVEEGLRYESPVQMMGRLAAEDVEIAGVRIVGGDRIGLILGAANRDPAHFADPDRFDISRADTRHLAFGGGPHFCVGAALGRVEAQVAVAAVVRRFPTLRLAADTIRWRPYPVFRGPVALPLAW